MALVSTTGLSAPGILVIDRQDGAGNNTPEKTEFVSFTGVLSRSLTGITRALGGTIAIDHTSGALVESFLTARHWGDMLDFVGADHDSAEGEDDDNSEEDCEEIGDRAAASDSVDSDGGDR